MNKDNVMNFLLSEVKRLNEEEHVIDLAKAERFEELSWIECRHSNSLSDWLCCNPLRVHVADFPDNSSIAIALWLYNEEKVGEVDIFERWEEFANKLAEEAGDWGKSIAYQMREGNINNFKKKEFFTKRYASEYNPYKIN